MQISKRNKFLIAFGVIAVMLVSMIGLVACGNDNKEPEAPVDPNSIVNPLDANAADGRYKVFIKDKKPMGPSWMSDKVFEDYSFVEKNGDSYVYILLQKDTKKQMKDFRIEVDGNMLNAESVVEGNRLVHKFNLTKDQLEKPIHFYAFIPAMNKEKNFFLEFKFDEATKI